MMFRVFKRNLKVIIHISSQKSSAENLTKLPEKHLLRISL